MPSAISDSNTHAAQATVAATLALVAAAILWSFSGIAIKLLSGGPASAPTAEMHRLTLACYRSLAGGVMLLPLAWQRRHSLVNVPARWTLLGVAAFTLMSATFVIANTLTSAANAIVLQYTSPAWVVLLGRLLLKERAQRIDLLVLGLCMTGILIIVIGNGGEGTGVAVSLVSGFGYGAVTVFSRMLRPISAVVVTACYAMGSGLLLLPAVVLMDVHRITWAQAGWVLLLGLVQFTLPYLLFSWALQRTSATRASLITLLETVFNPLWTWLFLNERPPAATLAGAPLILGGVAMRIGWGARRTRSAGVLES